MSVVSLEKIRVFTPLAEAGTLMKVLQEAGCLEIVTGVPNDSDAFFVKNTGALYISNRHERIEMARTFFAHYHHEKFLKATLEEGRAYTSQEELATLAKNDNVESIIVEVEDFQFKLAELERTERSLNEDLQVLHDWERFELPLNCITETETTITYALRAPERPLNKTLSTIQDCVGDLISITPVGLTTTLITLLKTSQNQVEEIISAGGVSIVQLPNTTSTAATELRRLDDERHKLMNIKVSLTETIRGTAALHLPLLKKMSDITRWETERVTAAEALPTTERTVMVTAWVPRVQVKTIEASLDDNLQVHALEILEVGENEILPTEITNSNLIKPFESVTRLYGVPYHNDLDPTPVLSLFFFIFFGFCLSDAGYGLILMLLTGAVLWHYHLEEGMKNLLTLLFYGGVSTFLTGMLFGGYFGIDPTSLSTNYPSLSFLIELQKFDPINNPMPVFYLALVLGFIHVAFGIFLNLYRKFSLGETWSAWLDDAPWLYFFTLTALYILNMVGYLNPVLGTFLSDYSAYVFGSAVLLIVITQGRDKKNIFSKLISGILGLYGAVGYFADILSYSRLMALGLATGALAFSINSIAAFIGGDSFGIGTFFMFFVLILGHTLNIVISLLGTFINSARLQFVEFFSKFSTGTGRPFVPFRKEARHVIILPNPPSP